MGVFCHVFMPQSRLFRKELDLSFLPAMSRHDLMLGKGVAVPGVLNPLKEEFFKGSGLLNIGVQQVSELF